MIWPAPEQFLLLQLLLAALLSGLAWTVQVAIYPVFKSIPDSASFRAYHDRYTKQITFLVGPLMVIELLISPLFVISPTLGQASSMGWILALMAPINLVSTGIFFVPMHNRIANSAHDTRHELIDRLVSLSYLRTGIWTLKSFLILRLLYWPLG